MRTTSRRPARRADRVRCRRNPSGDDVSPVRVQLSRKKGWRKPDNTVVVARPSSWGNPYAVRRGDDLVTFDYDEDESVGPGGCWHVVALDQSGFTCPDTAVMSAWATKADAVAAAVECYRWRATEAPGHWDFVLYRIDALRGKNLACWCPLDQPCHADVLLELANQ